MVIKVFTANIAGQYLLKALDSFNCYPEIVTYEPGSRKTALYRDLSPFGDKFNITKLTENKFAPYSDKLNLSDSVSVCVDWTKDFFKGFEGELDVIYAHPAVLPLYKGYSAVTEQFLRGVVETGVSFYKASEVIDGGDVYQVSPFRIEFEDYPDDFYRKYAEKCAEFIVDLYEKGENDITPVPQDEDKGFYLVRKRQREGLIDFGKDAYSLYNHIRGFAKPFFGSFFYSGDKKITVWKASTEKWQGFYGVAGEVIGQDEYGLEIACGSGTIILQEVDIDGKIYRGEDIEL